MTSAIVRTNPTAGTATTSSVRDNFGFAADEINVLQRSSTELKPTTNGGSNPYNVDFGSSPTFSFVNGARISVRINATNTASANIIVAPGVSPIPIVKTDNSSLLAGDLVADSIYDLIYNANSSLGYPVWIALNVDVITSQDALLTTMLGGLYPVGSLLTTTLATDPGTADYFFSGITFGTWEAYAQGRTIVGIDTGTTINSAISASNVVTLNVASHSLSAGDLIAVSGFTSDTDANGEFTVDSTTSTTIIYTAANVSDGTLTGSSLLVKNAAFDTAQEVGGESTHMQAESEVGPHAHQVAALQTVTESGVPTSATSIARKASQSGSTNQAYEFRPATIDANVGVSSAPVAVAGGGVTTQTAMNNLQPYITTYIWKRTV